MNVFLFFNCELNYVGNDRRYGTVLDRAKIISELNLETNKNQQNENLSYKLLLLGTEMHRWVGAMVLDTNKSTPI